MGVAFQQDGFRRAVFLDRDGVLNRAVVRNRRPFAPGSLEELVIPAGVEDACAALRAARLLLIVVTNQPDVARGLGTAEGVEAINERLRERLVLDDVRTCPHDDRDGCDCRKPKPGLILEAARDWKIELAASVMVGDRWRDIEAGRGAGCKTVFIDHGYDEPGPERADLTVRALVEAVPWIVQTCSGGHP